VRGRPPRTPPPTSWRRGARRTVQCFQCTLRPHCFLELLRGRWCLVCARRSLLHSFRGQRDVTGLGGDLDGMCGAGVFLWLLAAVGRVLCSEFPERECCDLPPPQPTALASSSTTAASTARPGEPHPSQLLRPSVFPRPSLNRRHAAPLRRRRLARIRRFNRRR
jgi:hypothetical protein